MRVLTSSTVIILRKEHVLHLVFTVSYALRADKMSCMPYLYKATLLTRCSPNVFCFFFFFFFFMYVSSCMCVFVCFIYALNNPVHVHGGETCYYTPVRTLLR